MTSASCAVPDRGISYPVEIGASFLNHKQSPYCSLRYDFQPASVSRTTPGVLQQIPGGRVSLYLGNNNTGELDVHFQGKYEAAKDDLDVLAIFDGHSFRLEQLSGHIKTRHTPGSRYGGGAPLTSNTPLLKATSPDPHGNTDPHGSGDQIVSDDDGDSWGGVAASVPSCTTHSGKQPGSFLLQNGSRHMSPLTSTDTGTRSPLVQGNVRSQGAGQGQPSHLKRPSLHQASGGANTRKVQNVSKKKLGGQSHRGYSASPLASPAARGVSDLDEDQIPGDDLDAAWEEEEEEEEDKGFVPPPLVKGQQHQSGKGGALATSATVTVSAPPIVNQIKANRPPGVVSNIQNTSSLRPQQLKQRQTLSPSPTTASNVSIHKGDGNGMSQVPNSSLNIQPEAEAALVHKTRPLATPSLPASTALASKSVSPHAAPMMAPKAPSPQLPMKAAVRAPSPLPFKAVGRLDAMNPLEAAWAASMDEDEEEEEEEPSPPPRSAQLAIASAPAPYEGYDEDGDEDDEGDANRCSDDDSAGGVEYF